MYENQVAKSLTGPLYNPLGDADYQPWLQKQQTAPQAAPQVSPIGQQIAAAAFQPQMNTTPMNQWHGDNQQQVGVPTTGGADVSQGQQQATQTARETATGAGVQTGAGAQTPTGEFFSHKRLGDADVEKGLSLAAGLLVPGLAPTLTAGIGLAELAYQGGKWLYNKFNGGTEAPGPGQDMSKSPYSNYDNWYEKYQATHPADNSSGAQGDNQPPSQPEGTPTGYTTGSGTTYTPPSNSTPTNQWHSPGTNGGYNNAGESDTTSSDTG